MNHPNHPWGISPPPATPSRTHTRWTQAIYANIYMRTRSASFLRRASFPGSLHKPTVGGVIDARVNSRMAKLNSLHIGHTMLDSISTPSSSDFSVVSVLCHGRLSLGYAGAVDGIIDARVNSRHMSHTMLDSNKYPPSLDD